MSVLSATIAHRAAENADEQLRWTCPRYHRAHALLCAAVHEDPRHFEHPDLRVAQHRHDDRLIVRLRVQWTFGDPSAVAAPTAGRQAAGCTTERQLSPSPMRSSDRPNKRVGYAPP